MDANAYSSGNSDSGNEHNIEDNYLMDLTNELLRFLMMKRGGSFLILGGNNWNYGRSLWNTSTAPTCVYADSKQEVLDVADEDEALTVLCDLGSATEIANLGKYDGIVAKDVLEYNTDTFGELLAALYRILKYNGKALLVSRFSPTLPLPKTVSDNWRNSMPDMDRIESEAKESEFTVAHRNVKFQACLEKEEYAKILLSRPWPFMNNVTEADVDELLSKFPDLIKFEDKLDLILLTKEMID